MPLWRVIFNMQQQFVHLRVHSEYSLVDGLLRIKPLMHHVAEQGMNAIAVTDHCNLFAAVKVFQMAVSQGIKPIIGCDIPWHDDLTTTTPYSMVLLCQNEIGYRHLTRLVSKAYQHGQQQGKPRVKREWIMEHAEGLIALSGGVYGDIGQAILSNDIDLAKQWTKQWQSVFNQRFYLEIQRTGRAQEHVYNDQIVKIADLLKAPLVATNDVRFLQEEDFEAHEARVCIHQGLSLADPRRQKHYSAKQYLRSTDEMVDLFKDLPNALANTVEISKRCTVKLALGKNYLPNFPLPSGFSVEHYLSSLSKQGLQKRLEKLFPAPEFSLNEKRGAYDERLALELDVINSMGFAGYFLIVADFINWAKKNGIPVGPGRGSGAGSLVAYALDITDLDPLAYDLLFERFLNPERVSMPDFDIDFCMEGRDRVIDYVAEKYGRQSVSQIITFGSMAAKAVVRDVGRVLGHPYGFVDKLAKMIPFELGMTLTKALSQEEELKRRYEDEEEVKELLDLAMKLEGVVRNAGKHAGGVVIAPSELTDFTAIYCEQDSSQLVSQFDKDDVEAVGLVKFDFLGLRTLTIIDWALHTVNEIRKKNNQEAIEMNDMALDDKASFDLLKAGHTTAVFQLESRGMKELILRLQPDCFEDIIALVALFRPGPLQSGMVDDFIDRKHGRAAVEYPHPDLEPILKPTYGVILYQEQVMQIAQVLANYTLGAADLLRRAMGKKKPEEMAKQREIFVQGAEGRGVDAQVAASIFDLMEKFAGYGFNKSHSAAYALVAFQTAWLKAHYAAAFMAAVLSSDMDNTDKITIFLQECKQMGITVLPPAINRCQYRFTVADSKTILYGLGAIKGIGEAAIIELVDKRQQAGHYTGLFDLCKRVDLRKVNRRVLEALIKSGCLDDWQVERAGLMASLAEALQAGQHFHQHQLSGQTDLFSLLDEESDNQLYCFEKPWSDKQRLDGEKETLGFYFTGHPASAYAEEFSTFITPINSLDPLTMKQVKLCGLIKQIRKILTKKGKKLAILTVEDVTHHLDVVVFSEVFEAASTAIQSGQLWVIEGEISRDDYTGGIKMVATTLHQPHEIRERLARCVQLTLSKKHQPLLPTLHDLFKRYQGTCIVQINYQGAHVQAAMNLPVKWGVTPSDDLLQLLAELLGPECVRVDY